MARTAGPRVLLVYYTYTWQSQRVAEAYNAITTVLLVLTWVPADERARRESGVQPRARTVAAKEVGRCSPLQRAPPLRERSAPFLRWGECGHAHDRRARLLGVRAGDGDDARTVLRLGGRGQWWLQPSIPSLSLIHI